MHEEPVPDRQLLLKAPRFNVERVSHRLKDGTLMSREVVRHPGAVVVVPVIDDEHLCLIRNFRVSVSLELLELPAGTLEPNEPPIETARRELTEETGYHCDSMEPLCDFYMSPGILDEHIYCFVAKGLTSGLPNREVGEEITNCVVTLHEAERMLQTGEIKDAKSIAALHHFLRYHVR